MKTMNKILVIISLFVVSLFLFGCSNKDEGIQEKNVKCPALCLDECAKNGLEYVPSKQQVEATKCSIICTCSKIITYDFISKQ